MAGRMYFELYHHSFAGKDLDSARGIYRKVIEKYPNSAYAGRAKNELEKIDVFQARSRGKKGAAGQGQKADMNAVIMASRDQSEKNRDKVGIKIAKSSVAAKNTGTVNPVTVKEIRYWSNPEYTRIVIDADGPTDFSNNLLKRDPRINKLHKRLYVDLKNCRLGGGIKEKIPIDDSLLKDVRAGQFTPNTVRVVVDIKSFENYNIFSLNNPFRIVIDVRGRPVGSSVSEGAKNTNVAKGAVSIARQLALGVHRIVIDAGHGGKDYGAPGVIRGVHEKNVVLAIAKRLAKKIKKDLGVDVIMTRKTDRYLTLEERTAIANTRRADLFISIHANASTNHNAHGIETYYLNLTTDNESIAVAARENATSEKNISELQTILNDLMRNAKINESSRFANYVQHCLYRRLKKDYSKIKDKGIKRAPFYVLLGAQMPSILIETSFISNKRECRRLTSKAYQDELCDGIVDGVKKYMREIRPTAFNKPN
ncbi:MAG: N-acetylmuramoyl-L-alanine amidase [Deltaproteobacteria bacterium]|nr:N-acetylmuramoyl-L-alanine amidase [Deltaproteobacteria bacterium]